MIFDRDDTEYIPDPSARRNIETRCGECKDERDAEVFMEAAQSYQPGYVADVWRCPACGHEVMQGGADNERFY